MPTSLAAGLTPGFLAVDDLCGWKIKTYAVAASSRPRIGLMSAAKRVAAGILPHRPDRDGAFGTGFLIVHDTATCCLALIHWWVRPDELRQRVFAAPPEQPRTLVPEENATIGRLPELAIIAHEREAWLRHALDHPGGPDLGAYLADILR